MRGSAVLLLAIGCQLEPGGPELAADGAAARSDSGHENAASEGGGGDAGAPDAGGDADDLDADAGALDTGADSGQAITITGGPYAIDGPDAGVCSMNGSSTTFTLQNQHGASVDLWWVNYTCNEVSYGTIAANGMKVQGTYTTHVWRVRETLGQALLGEFRLTGTGPYVVTVH